MQKPGLPQGTRDFSAEVVRKRNYILNTIRTVFELYGFQPLETPAMENLDTLMGKYGEEGDKLIFKVLNNGLSDPKNTDKAKEGFEAVLQGKSSALLTERALKYDLTIPFARFVAMNHQQLTYPYKRYQIQPVWRADRPQKGRYREFTQCDADIVGSRSLINEVELSNIYHNVFTRLGLPGYVLKINSRKILAALSEVCGGSEKLTDITVAIDKLDKIGIEKVKEELTNRGLDETQVSVIEKYLNISGNAESKLAQLRALFAGNEQGNAGMAEIEFVLKNTADINIEVDLTLARGLNYYTGIIFEVKAPDTVKMGSIGGGGRYDDLTSLFGVKDLTGVGISFGVDRIYDVLEELELFPKNLVTGAKALFFNLGEEEAAFAYKQLELVRKAGISGEIYHEQAKMDKQFKYGERKNITYAVIIGTKEMEENKAVVKNIAFGTQEIVPFEKLAEYLYNRINVGPETK